MSGSIRDEARHSAAAPKDRMASGITQSLVRRHLVAGWLGLAIFLFLGIVLEAMHALKMEYYLDLRNSARRMMWTLGHAHGTLFSVVSIALAWTISQVYPGRLIRGASWGMLGGLVLLPLGFFLGGLDAKGGDPGLGILLVPVGAASMLIGAVCAAAAVFKFMNGANETLRSSSEFKKVDSAARNR